MSETDPTAIERFVRGTLGCQCPDEVFRDVVVAPLVPPTGRGTGRKLVIGGRLLIYLAAAPDAPAGRDWLERLAVSGRDERDRRRFNRFRLVLTAPDAGPVRRNLEERFSRALGGDDRAHLHLLAADQAPVV